MDNHSLRYFMLNNLAIESGIKNIAKELEINLGPEHQEKRELDNNFYPQFPLRIQEEAARMAKNYTIFYALENSIRELISDVMKKHGDGQRKLLKKIIQQNY